MTLVEALKKEYKVEEKAFENDISIEEAFESGYALGQFEVTNVEEFVPEEKAIEYLEKSFEALEKVEAGFENEAVEILAPISNEIGIAFESDENKSTWEKIKDFIIKVTKYIKDKAKAFGELLGKLYRAVVEKLKNMTETVKSLVSKRDEEVKEAEDEVKETEKKVDEEIKKSENKEAVQAEVEQVENAVESGKDDKEIKSIVESAKAAGVANAAAVAAIATQNAKAKQRFKNKVKANKLLLAKLEDETVRLNFFKDRIKDTVLATMNFYGSDEKDLRGFINYAESIMSGKPDFKHFGLQDEIADKLGLPDKFKGDTLYVCLYSGVSFWLKGKSEDDVKVIHGAVSYLNLKSDAKFIKSAAKKIYPNPKDIVKIMGSYEAMSKELLPKIEKLIKQVEKENAMAAKEALKAKGKMSLEELKAVKGKTMSMNSLVVVLPYLAKAITAASNAAYELIIAFENHCRDLVNKEMGEKVLDKFNPSILKG